LRPPPWSTVTDCIPATDPAKVTRPAAAAPTGVPESTPKSTPQCPAYAPIGAKAWIRSPDTGGDRAAHGAVRLVARSKYPTMARKAAFPATAGSSYRKAPREARGAYLRAVRPSPMKRRLPAPSGWARLAAERRHAGRAGGTASKGRRLRRLRWPGPWSRPGRVR